MNRTSKVVMGLGAVLAAMTAAASTAEAAPFANTNPIQIVDKPSDLPVSGTANPYPSEIEVTGRPGGVSDITVTIEDLTHSFLDDVAIVLQSPGGQTLMLMNRIGPVTEGNSPASGVTDVDLTFRDDAAAQLQDLVVPVSGAYRPTNRQTGSALDSFPAPGPGSSYGNPGPGASGTATLASQFEGRRANGTWKLFVLDTASDDAGDIGGWSLDITSDGDITPPDTQIVSGPSGTIATRTASFTFATVAPESGASFECKLDSAAWAPCASPHELNGLADGQHTFSVQALDVAGNADPSPAERSFVVASSEPPPTDPPLPPAGGEDAVAPTASIDKVKVNRRKRTAKVTFAGSDDVTPAGSLSFSCRLDAKGAKPCSSPASFKRLKPGKHKLAITVRDGAGNVSEPAVETFKVKRRR